MKCPRCGERLVGIAPCSSEEWKCVNDDCPSHPLEEYYGTTQAEVNATANLEEEASK